jgi:hypothetical protein
MKRTRPARKLTLNAETIAHLRQISTAELDLARGGLPIEPVETFGFCTKTTTMPSARVC